ncbi:MAG: fimbrillin family protein [Bacteroidales bacterium]|nr:fimbrillin family protein [Bacteroidales bacterium]
MKKAFVALVVLASLCSCDKEGTKDGPLPGRTPILFGIGSTRAVGETDADKIQQDENGFKVAAIMADDKLEYFNEAAKWDDSETAKYYKTDQWHYYPTGAGEQALDFYAVYPADKEIAVNEETGALTIDDYVPRNGTTLNPGEDLVAAVKTGVWAPTGNEKIQPVNLVFKHILSRLTVSCCGKEPGVDYKLTSGSITYNNKATFTFDAGNDMGGDWTVASDGGTMTRTLSAQDIPYSDDHSAYGVKFMTDVPVIPGDVVISLTWKCFIQGTETQIGDECSCTQTLSPLDVKEDDTPNPRGALMGKISTIKCWLGYQGQPIVFTVEVTPWGTSDQEVDFLPSAS